MLYGSTLRTFELGLWGVSVAELFCTVLEVGSFTFGPESFRASWGVGVGELFHTILDKDSFAFRGGGVDEPFYTIRDENLAGSSPSTRSGL